MLYDFHICVWNTSCINSTFEYVLVYYMCYIPRSFRNGVRIVWVLRKCAENVLSTFSSFQMCVWNTSCTIIHSGREYVVWNIRLGLEYVSSNYMSDMKFRFGSWIRLALILRSGLEYVLFNYRCYMISTYVSSIRLI